jgi:hypothetical protein
MRIEGYGIRVDLPDGWEGRIYRRPEGFPVLQLGNFALPVADGDFGSQAAREMGRGAAFAAMPEYDPALAGVGLFQAEGLPLPVREDEASPKAMPQILRERSGIQRFFTESGRAFCLYVVLRAPSNPRPLVRALNQVLGTVQMTPR